MLCVCVGLVAAIYGLVAGNHGAAAGGIGLAATGLSMWIGVGRALGHAAGRRMRRGAGDV
jgi:hypothetical protein